MRWTSLAIGCLCVVAAAAIYKKDSKYVIEGYFVFDNEAFANYEREDSARAVLNGLTDMVFFLTTVNERLAGLKKDGLDIQLRVLKTQITSNIYQPKGRWENSPKDILKSFDSWLETTQAKQRLGHDLAIYFTGHKIPTTSIGDQAGSICESIPHRPEYPITVVPFDGSTFMINALLKNLGLILGADTDGSGSYNIMRFNSYNPLPSEQIYEFDSCTAYDIKEFFAARDVRCLLELSGIKHSSVPNTKPEFYSGRAQDPDVLCSRRVHKDSVACRYPPLYEVEELGGDIVCQKIFCTTESDYMICDPQWPSEGMACNPNKVCRKGKCVHDKSKRKSLVIEGCAFGDEKAPLNWNGDTCASQLKTLGPPMCYEFGGKCCETCAKYKTTYPNCKWGDKQIANHGVPTSCDAFLTTYGMGNCYDDTFASLCCKSCGDWLAKNRGRR
ncbi:A disintegrin and metalloproteinase with thrombospondin motifs 5 [Elysia marginata]|uniref:A disintegrin and metalloproteinase with thrombospondin motifs 5 n=1 Tax=Elysia marginata TaxID=1093978 RepID=A0AAV4H7G7_9GAST|nr:A disintegrin and metalloproteinase with thrombospondin motifs 5 [Elysia marginata]